MKPRMVSKHVLAIARVYDLCSYGIWMLIAGHEYFLPFEQMVWLKEQAILTIFNAHILHTSKFVHKSDLAVVIDE